MILYHYTSLSAWEQIKDDGVIKTRRDLYPFAADSLDWQDWVIWLADLPDAQWADLTSFMREDPAKIAVRIQVEPPAHALQRWVDHAHRLTRDQDWLDEFHFNSQPEHWWTCAGSIDKQYWRDVDLQD